MITVFGSVNYDLIGGVSRLPRPGETILGNAFATAPGGKGANQAHAARRAGASVRLSGAVGEDGFAEPALALLRADGVDLTLVKHLPGPTGIALILVDRIGENVIVVIAGANGAIGEADAMALEFSPGDVLLLQLEIPVPAIAAAGRRAREAGARVVVNFAPFHADAVGLLDHATHLVVNETECALLAGMAGDEIESQAKALAEKKGLTVIVTLGRAGVFAIEGGRILEAPALPIDAVDTVGAGDTFCGYLAAGLSEGLALAQALTLAASAASLACTKAGAQPAIPRREFVESAIRTSGS